MQALLILFPSPQIGLHDHVPISGPITYAMLFLLLPLTIDIL